MLKQLKGYRLDVYPTRRSCGYPQAVYDNTKKNATGAKLAANGYDLSINRYKEVVHTQVQHRAPQEILAELAKLEDEIAAGMKALEGVLK